MIAVKRVNEKQIVDELTFAVLSVFLLYDFWFQYAVKTIDGILSILGIIIMVLFFARLRLSIEFYRYILFVFLFILFSIVSGYLFALDRTTFSSLYIRILKYIIPMLCMYNYVGWDYLRLKKIMFVVAISVLALSISMFFSGKVDFMGAVIVGDLNSNVFSSFLLLGMTANIFLLNSSNSKFLTILLIGVIAVELVAQLFAASRRGILIFFFLIVTYIHSLISIKYNTKPFYKIVTVIFILAVVALVLVKFESINDKFIIIQEFGRTSGDSLRKQYQAVAWRLFLDNPICGQGLGCVQYRIGMYSHSLYYELLSSVGIIGIFIIIYPLLRKAVAFWKGSNRIEDGNVEDKIQLRSMAWNVIAVLITGVAVVYIYDANFYIFIAIFASTQSVYIHKQRKLSNY